MINNTRRSRSSQPHLSSYDHHHRKRFAEMREAERARNADATAEKRSREEARRERELQKQIRAAAGGAGAGSCGTGAGRIVGFGGFQTKKTSGAAPIKFSLDFGKKPCILDREYARDGVGSVPQC